MILIKSEPALQRRFNLLHESGIQNSNALFRLNSRNTSDPLRIERARLKSASLVGYLESGPAGCNVRGMYVTTALSWSRKSMLKMRHGRVFYARPKSVMPRLALSTAFLPPYRTSRTSPPRR